MEVSKNMVIKIDLVSKDFTLKYNFHPPSYYIHHQLSEKLEILKLKLSSEQKKYYQEQSLKKYKEPKNSFVYHA